MIPVVRFQTREQQRVAWFAAITAVVMFVAMWTLLTPILGEYGPNFMEVLWVHDYMDIIVHQTTWNSTGLGRNLFYSPQLWAFGFIIVPAFYRLMMAVFVKICKVRYGDAGFRRTPEDDVDVHPNDRAHKTKSGISILKYLMVLPFSWIGLVLAALLLPDLVFYGSPFAWYSLVVPVIIWVWVGQCRKLTEIPISDKVCDVVPQRTLFNTVLLPVRIACATMFLMGVYLWLINDFGWIVYNSLEWLVRVFMLIPQLVLIYIMIGWFMITYKVSDSPLINFLMGRKHSTGFMVAFWLLAGLLIFFGIMQLPTWFFSDYFVGWWMPTLTTAAIIGLLMRGATKHQPEKLPTVEVYTLLEEYSVVDELKVADGALRAIYKKGSYRYLVIPEAMTAEQARKLTESVANREDFASFKPERIRTVRFDLKGADYLGAEQYTWQQDDDGNWEIDAVATGTVAVKQQEAEKLWKIIAYHYNLR